MAHEHKLCTKKALDFNLNHPSMKVVSDIITFCSYVDTAEKKLTKAYSGYHPEPVRELLQEMLTNYNLFNRYLKLQLNEAYQNQTGRLPQPDSFLVHSVIQSYIAKLKPIRYNIESYYHREKLRGDTYLDKNKHILWKNPIAKFL